MRRDVDDLARMTVDCGFKLHQTLGPGLLESAYEACLAHSLVKEGLKVERQKVLPLHYDGEVIDAGFRIDLLVEDQLLIELKSVEAIAPVHVKQVLTYLRLMDLRLGLLLNFGAGTFREGCRRLANDYVPRAASSRP
ncbi:GxxExxY protein [Sphingomonas sp. ID1715]|uniref:GxxExxY protein n=1 Tax=Sphingomonas sp. ID1715 TaxID=1656898 RepID=UPI0014876C6E|nr:GxxExxY protein [Sphingomonas sp. ID1715]NNM78628.1 GxxExxY protein [Sphingomonas sp. ID1715]